MITLIQCALDIIESFENGLKCGLENYEAVVAVFQFLFSSFQFLFIFTRGNVI